MPVYRLVISGKGIQLPENSGNFLDVGFVKNVYLYSKSKENACLSGLSSIKSQLLLLANQQKIVINDLQVSVDDIEIIYTIWDLLKNEGFIFFTDED